MKNSSAAQKRRRKTLATPESSSPRSTKSTPAKPGTPGDGEKWRVVFHRDVRKTVAHHGLTNPQFRPTFGELIAHLENNPYGFPKKLGKLRDAYAAPLKFANVTWRAVFLVDDRERRVEVVGLGPHDQAYADAERRV